MRMNARMRDLVNELGIDLNHITDEGAMDLPRLQLVDECVLLNDEYTRARGARLGQFPDRTGFECFVNHVHLTVDKVAKLWRRRLAAFQRSADHLRHYEMGRSKSSSRLPKENALFAFTNAAMVRSGLPWIWIHTPTRRY